MQSHDDDSQQQVKSGLMNPGGDNAEADATEHKSIIDCGEAFVSFSVMSFLIVSFPVRGGVAGGEL